MAQNKLSVLAARSVNDLFARLHVLGYIAYPAASEQDVLVQYRSEQHGCTRTVACASVSLLQWLHDRAGSPGWRAAFALILDRKEAWEAPARQQELNLGEAAPVARRSMRTYD